MEKMDEGIHSAQPVAVKDEGHCVFPLNSENQPRLLMKVNRERYTAQKQAPDPTYLEK